MGNYLSCTLTNASFSASSAKVIFPDGQIRRFEGSISAAELMLDAPGHFLAEAQSMQLGQRLTALSADEELEMVRIYVMIPMNRLNAVSTPADMARVLVSATKEANKPVHASARVRPDSVSNMRETAARVDEVEDETAAVEISEFKHRLSCGRSRRPTLETIQEENFTSRRR